MIALAASTACSEGTAPEPAFLDVVSGAGITDTIGATLPDPLVVRLSNADGGLAGVVVRFSSAPGRVPVRLGPPGATPALDSYEVATDADGVARAYVQLGTQAGAARVLVETEDDATGFADYTVAPGAAVGARIEPGDTAITLGASFQPRALVIDRAGNATGGTTDFVVTPAIVLEEQAGQRVRGASTGRGRITATFGAAADTAFVSVVPDLVIAAVAVTPSSRVLVRVDAAGGNEVSLEHLPAYAPTRPHWNPTTGMIVYERTTGPGTALWTVDANGSNEALTNPELQRVASWPRYSDDGEWVYFAGNADPADAVRVGRVPAAGGAAQMIGPANVASIRAPDPGPDGRVVFESEGNVYTMDPDGGTTSLGAGAIPRWSPGGEVAFVDGGAVWLMRANGADRRALTAVVGASGECLDWSPDGGWLIVCSETDDRMHLVDAASGATLPLPWSEGYTEPAFAPSFVEP